MDEAYKNDLTDKKEYDNEMLRWKTKWLHSTGERPTTLADTLDCINPTLYRNVYAILTILLTMPVSTATPERSFSTMRRVKSYLRATPDREDRTTLSSCSNARAQGQRLTGRPWLVSFAAEEQDVKLRIPKFGSLLVAENS